MSDEELAKKRKEHPGLFSEPHTNHITKIKEESRLSKILRNKQ